MSREIIPPSIFIDCATCLAAQRAGSAALAQLPSEVANDVEVVCVLGARKAEITAKPKGKLNVNGQRTGEFGGVLYREQEDCPGLQSDS